MAESWFDIQQDHNILYASRGEVSYMMFLCYFEAKAFLLQKTGAVWTHIASPFKTQQARWDGSCNIKTDDSLECVLATTSAATSLYYFSFNGTEFKECFPEGADWMYGGEMEYAPAGIAGPDDSFMVFSNIHSYPNTPECTSAQSNCDYSFYVKWHQHVGNGCSFKIWDFTATAKPLYDELIVYVEGYKPGKSFDNYLTN